MLLPLWLTPQVDKIYPQPKTTEFFAEIAADINAQDSEVHLLVFLAVLDHFLNRLSLGLVVGFRGGARAA